ncbi:amidohydrolase family protein [Saccharothrix australiensis]|uniref:amidohydrolase family protein n=1 Tax=Saccharothrix australiensis TaxID=2072 RepID=UPI003CCC6406
MWRGLDPGITRAAASAGLARLATTGCTTAADHHYPFPRAGGDQFDALVSAGGLPPDDQVETTDAALAATERAIDAYHDPSPEAVVRVAVGPCSPFSVSRELLTGAAEPARAKGVRLHTHLAEITDEEGPAPRRVRPHPRRARRGHRLASSPTSPCGGSTARTTRASTTRWPRWSSVRDRWWSCWWSAAGPWWPAASCGPRPTPRSPGTCARRAPA